VKPCSRSFSRECTRFSSRVFYFLNSPRSPCISTAAMLPVLPSVPRIKPAPLRACLVSEMPHLEMLPKVTGASNRKCYRNYFCSLVITRFDRASRCLKRRIALFTLC
jgi:hypothetical protein